MLRAVVSKRVLDRLIREKVRRFGECKDVEPLPVVWRQRLGVECNWEIPGWSGDAGPARRCARCMDPYLRFLSEQFDIPDEGLA